MSTIKARGLVKRLYEEKIVLGGILYTRAGLYQEMVSNGGSYRQADYFAFGTRTATSEDIDGAINEVPNEYPDEVREMLGLAKRASELLRVHGALNRSSTEGVKENA